MEQSARTRLKWLVSGGSFLWIALAGWLAWSTLPQGAVEHHGSSSVKDRMATECTGSYRDRYECKEAIIIESGRDSFFSLGGRFLLVILPPLIATGWASSYLARNPVQLPEQHGHGSTDWKIKARAHTHSSPLHDEEDNAGHSAVHASMDSPPPSSIPDWKRKAQQKMHPPGHPPRNH